MAKKGRAGKSRGSLVAGSGEGMTAADHESVMSDASPAKPHELHAREALDHAGASAPELGRFGSVEADPFADPGFDADDGSVPPMGDLDTEFFARATDSWEPGAELYETEATPPNPRLIALKSMAARRRRAQFAKYVTAAVGVCGVICLTAMVKLVVSRAAGTDESDTQATAHAMIVTEPAAPPNAPSSGPAPSQAAPIPQPAEAPAVAAAVPVEPQARASAASVPSVEAPASPPPLQGAPPVTAPADNAAPNAAAVTAAVTNAQPASASETSSSPSGAPATADSAAEAAAAREVARKELSRGHARQSIEAGERSVALDPTDGEAWLVLGAAYQSKGAVADARRCFRACVSQAKRGPRGECSAMLR